MRTLPGAEKYLQSAAVRDRKPQSWAERLIERADEVSIFDVLSDFFDIYVPREGTSFKARCPFGDEHPDGGLDKGWRTYPMSNSSNCFVMHGPMGPVRLVQLREGIKATRAANLILDRYGLNRPRAWRDRYWDVAVEVEQRQNRPVAGDPALAVEALNIALRKEPEYVRRQFDDDVLHAMEVVLDRLDAVMLLNDPDALRAWYDKAKSVMLQIVKRKKET